MPPPLNVARRGARLAGITTYAALAASGFAAAQALSPTSASAAGSSGGAGVAPPPRITDARCLAARKRACADPHWVQPGARVALSGRNLSGGKEVIFYGAPGPADDVRAPTRAERRGFVVTVPERARSGPLAVVTQAGGRSTRWSGLVIEPLATAAPGTPAAAKVFYGSLQPAAFTYQLPGGASGVDVALVRLGDRAVVRTWSPGQAAPGIPQRVTWDGTAGGRVQPDGIYSFRVSSRDASGSQVVPPGAEEPQPFAFYNHMFPVQGPHRFGGGSARFGASRGGRSHQGQDVFADCGTPLLAARAGSVVYSGYHALAGNYLVLHGKGSGLDYVYMHLRQPALVKTGASVYTGQPIGEVGDTGNAEGCHLHFELWSAPGWYKGGHPFDPLPELKRWDQAS